MSRFNELFWAKFIRGYKPELIGVANSGEKFDTDTLSTKITDLIGDAHVASVMMSRNEDRDDACTSSILFTVLPYVSGSLLYHHGKYDRNSRLVLLQQVSQYWDQFRAFCNQLGFMNELLQPAVDSRETKINALRRREITKSAFMNVFNAGDLDEVRDSVLDVVEFFAIECEIETAFLNQEIEILNSAPVEVSEPSSSSIEDHNRRKPWTLKLDKSSIRSIMTKEVFRPDISMPSMSLAELANLEVVQMRQAAATRTPEANDESIGFYCQEAARSDLEDEKARLWDDWKDDNPRGSGNKLVNLG